MMKPLSNSVSHWRRLVSLSAIALASLPASLLAADSVSISKDWRFTKGDPAGLTTDLRYDVRPPIEDAGDGKLADT
ncbi:hypothetical protein NL432_26495, partial [Klebsiella pneumoniae]|nr:hypothetical protein [Klebsiella pneumoniae]